MGGNYAMAPPRFLRLYVIRVSLGSTTVGIVYALLQRKTQDTYEELLHALLDKYTSMELYPDPRTILVDFEQCYRKTMEIITTIRGKQKQKICLEGFICTKQITSKTQIRWQCVKRCSNQCKGVISTTLDLVRYTKSRNHDANLMEVAVAKVERFEDSSTVLSSLSVFDPSLVPKADEIGFKEYGQDKIRTLSQHFYQERSKDERSQIAVTSKNRRRLPSKKSGGRCKNLVDNLPTPASSETEVQDAGVQTDMLLHVDQEVDEIRQTLVEVKNLGDYNYYQRKEAENLSGSQVPNTKPHNHDANLMEVAKAKVELKHLATNTRERPATLLSAKLAELPAADRQLFHEDDATNKMIRRVRKGQFPPV
ncbi:hypothetical protein GQR58_026434 [Nymphon striatum]|nr:hypothetical protein GQR58_026434 [Nymphon striatum]